MAIPVASPTRAEASSSSLRPIAADRYQSVSWYRVCFRSLRNCQGLGPVGSDMLLFTDLVEAGPRSKDDVIDETAANIAPAATTCDDLHLPLSCFRSGAVAFLYCCTSHRTYRGGEARRSLDANNKTRGYAMLLGLPLKVRSVILGSRFMVVSRYEVEAQVILVRHKDHAESEQYHVCRLGIAIHQITGSLFDYRFKIDVL